MGLMGSNTFQLSDSFCVVIPVDHQNHQDGFLIIPRSQFPPSKLSLDRRVPEVGTCEKLLGDFLWSAVLDPMDLTLQSPFLWMMGMEWEPNTLMGVKALHKLPIIPHITMGTLCIFLPFCNSSWFRGAMLSLAPPYVTLTFRRWEVISVLVITLQLCALS